MTYSRASKGNENGIEEAVKGIDPLERKVFMLPRSLSKLLEDLVYEAKNDKNTVNVSMSELVRAALIDKYVID